MKRIFVIIKCPPEMLYNALFCGVLPTSTVPSLTSNNVTENAKGGKMRQVVAVNRSKKVVEQRQKKKHWSFGHNAAKNSEIEPWICYIKFSILFFPIQAARAVCLEIINGEIRRDRRVRR